MLSYLCVFIVFICLLFPFVSQSVRTLTNRAMLNRAEQVILIIQSAPNEEAMIRRLKDQKHLIFFRISVINDKRQAIYDSHVSIFYDPDIEIGHLVNHSEVLDAFRNGVGYSEGYSEKLGQSFSYLAKSFDFHDKTYVIRTAFPYEHVMDAMHDFEAGFLILGGVTLLLFTMLTLIVISYLSRPIQKIIEAIRPYQEGKESTIPIIKINSNSNDDFDRLATTINYLSARVKTQIETLTNERNEKLALLESLTEGVIAVRDDLVVVYANGAALDILKKEAREVIDHPFEEFGLDSQCKEILIDCQAKQEVIVDTLEIHKGAKKIYLDLVATPITGDRGAVLVMQDTSVQHRVLEMRKDFIANASHELKTPITIIRGFAETLHDNYGLPETTYHDITRRIVASCNRMTHLVKDLLVLADIENLPYTSLTECDLVEIIQRCIQVTQSIYPDANIQVFKEENGEYHVIGVPDLIEMAFMNLLSNAAKYSKGPAEITVTFKNILEGVLIAVRDKGIGIPEHDQENIFQRFYTVDKAHSRKLGGTGLGLSIVKTIIEKHFGEIGLTSKLGEGTTFDVYLPFHQETHAD